MLNLIKNPLAVVRTRRTVILQCLFALGWSEQGCFDMVLPALMTVSRSVVSVVLPRF